YRPVVMASYALNYAWGGEDPTGYHLVNVVLHAANSAMVFLLVEELFPGRALAFLCALLFALHPLRTEAVASIVGRAESLAAFFMLAAWLGYVRGRRRPGLTARLLPPVAFALAALTKESSLAFVALLPVTDFLMGKEPL